MTSQLIAVRNVVLLCSAACLSLAQGTTTSSVNFIMAKGAKSPPLPSYVVYRHFLAWTSALDRGSKSRGLTDSYAFAKPFSNSVGFGREELGVIKTHAKSLEQDLAQQDAKAAAIITSYRQLAQAALQEGKPLPPPPAILRELDGQKTAIMINHYVAFRSKLGPTASSKLDVYLSREFVPHINISPLSQSASKSAPASDVTSSGFALPLH